MMRVGLVCEPGAHTLARTMPLSSFPFLTFVPASGNAGVQAWLWRQQQSLVVTLCIALLLTLVF